MTESPKSRVLSKAQLAFAALLRNNPKLSAKDAALQAGCTATSARVMGPRWRKLPGVQEIIGGAKRKPKATTKSNSKATRQKAKATPQEATNEDLKATQTTLATCHFDDNAESLGDRHQRFCLELLVDGNATRAYQRVYPHCTYESARREASRLLTNVDIQARIEELQEARRARLSMTADQVLEHLVNLATYDTRDLFDADGRLLPLDQLSPDAARLITGFSTKATVQGEADDGICIISNVKLPDRLRAAELLGRFHKLFVDKIEVSEDTEFARRLSEAVKAGKAARHGKKS